MSKNKIRVRRVDEDRIVFAAVLTKSGVPTIPKYMDQVANKIIAKYSKTLNYAGGNFEEVWFVINESFTEEEAEQIEVEYS